MRIGIRIALGSALAVVLVLPFALRPRPAASTAEPDARLPARKLILISPHWEGIRVEFGRAFSKWTARRHGYRTELEWLDVGGTSDAIRYVKSEFTRSPAGIRIDLFFGGGVDPFMRLADAALLDAVELPEGILDRIPRSFAGIEVYDAQRRWFGAALSGFGILYNRRVCRRLGIPFPQTWMDLAKPAYFTWVGSGDPRSSGSVHMAYEIILQAYGWEEGWAVLAGMCGNTRSFSRSASQVPKDTAMGEVACGMVIDVYAWRQVAEVGADRMGFVLPRGATVINPDGIAVLKGAPDRDLAAEFISFVLSETGQKLWCLKPGDPEGPERFELDRMPVIPGLTARLGDRAAVSYDPYRWEGGFTYDAAKGALRWSLLNDLVGAVLIDTHRELVSAWRVVKHLPADAAARRAFVCPPLSEEEAAVLAATRWDDPAFRARTRARWANQARMRYQRIATEGS